MGSSFMCAIRNKIENYSVLRNANFCTTKHRSMSDSYQNKIISILTQQLNPQHLEVLNESHQHSVPKNSETHFKIVIVSDQFNNLSFVQRQRKINELLKEFMGNPIHALTMGTYTVLEWNQKGKQAKPSPPCLGGSKKS